MIEQIVFEKDEKVKSIDFDTLVSSSDYDRGKKFPKSHYAILADVQNIMDQEGYDSEITDLFISKSGVILPKEREVAFRTDIETIYDTRGVQITNLIAKINMKGELADDNSSQSFAMSFNKNGIEVSFGTNVTVCSNMTIMGSGSHLSNYGNDSIDFDKMFEIIRLWIKTAKSRREKDLTLINNMKLITFTNFLKESREIIGHFNELLIRDGNSAPLRQGRITEVHRGLLEGYDEALKNKESFNLWDMFNVFTQSSSHQDVIENRIANSAAIGKYFVERYHLDEVTGDTIVVDMATILDEPIVAHVESDIEYSNRVIEEDITEIIVMPPKEESVMKPDAIESSQLEPLEEKSIDVAKHAKSVKKRIKSKAKKMKTDDEIKSAEKIVERDDLTDEQKAYAKDVLADKPIIEDPGEVQAEQDEITLF